jgi:hypothetical protein
MGMPLHCHYSGVWDRAAGMRHPDWAVVSAVEQADGPAAQNSGTPPKEKMCPRSAYLDNLMIPQLLELIDRYKVDGFWVDGDLWAVEPCYCDRCRAAYADEFPGQKPPVDPGSPDWAQWWDFTRRSFEAYVTRYCEAVHCRKPGVLVCSNWLQTFRNPGEPLVPTDWISGDNSWVWGLDGSRCEARFLSTRGKPWDIMLWTFTCSHGMGKPDSPWTAKPVQMLQQEAAVLLSFGGNVQLYETPGLRDGRLVPWRQERWGAVRRFVKERQDLCQGSDSVPQVAVLHSERHLRSGATGPNLMWDVDVAPVQGAVFALLEGHFGVDILDEWALLKRVHEFPVVVAAEQDRMSDGMVDCLKQYVREGGTLVVTGAESVDRLGEEFLGVTVTSRQPTATYFVPAADGAVPVHSDSWALLRATDGEGIGRLGTSPLLDDRLTEYPAAVRHRVGRGTVVTVPFSVCRDFNHNRYPLTRGFLVDLVRQSAPRLDFEVSGPVGVDVALRRKADRLLVHFVNRVSGIPNQPNNGTIDSVPEVGPLVFTWRSAPVPSGVSLEFAPERATWSHVNGDLRVIIPRVGIHSILSVTAGHA